MKIVSSQQDRAATERLAVSQGAHRFDHRRSSTLHVRRAAAMQNPLVNSRRYERPMDCVEVAVELQRPTLLTRIEAGSNRGCFSPTGDGAFDFKSLLAQ